MQPHVDEYSSIGSIPFAFGDAFGAAFGLAAAAEAAAWLLASISHCTPDEGDELAACGGAACDGSGASIAIGR